MKVYFALLFISSVPLLSLAQNEFAPLGARWTNPANGDFLEVTRDTIVNGIAARIIEKKWRCYDHFRNEPCDTSAEIWWEEYMLRPEIVYNDKDKVYQLLHDSFYLLYDFDVKVGDIMKIHAFERIFPNDIIYFFALVDSVVIFMSGEISLRAYHLSDLSDERTSFYRFTGWIVEKLGKEFYLFPFNNQDEDLFGFPFFARCYEDPIFSHAASSDCVLGLGNKPPGSIHLYPNPTSTELFIEFPEARHPSHVLIYNVTGSLVLTKEVTSSENQLTVSVDDLESGYYVIFLAPNFRLPFIIIH
ncbi:MAG: T9SS type A sorting domain-containing protein [Saprospiraceae bacterium]|nr:T9SS type A sorting domain-containing protein [Saprospiraceae bacterium]